MVRELQPLEALCERCRRPILLGLASAALLACRASGMAGGERVEACDGSRTWGVQEPECARLARALRELAVSCSVDSTTWAGTEDAWRRALAGPHIRAIQARPRPLEVAGRRVTPSEILLPLPRETWPDHVLVRDGSAVLAFTKYQPEALAELARGSRLGPGDPLDREYLVRYSSLR